MARVTVVKKAQKAQGNCEKCGKPIEVGDSYKWCAPRAHRAARGFKRKRCLSCPSWRPSETTSSSALSALYGAQEAAEDALSEWDRQDLDDLKQIATEAAEGVREAAEVYRESATNIEDGFGHSTSISDELNEKADTLDGQADDLENALDYVDEWDDDAKRDEATEEALGETPVWQVVNEDGSGVVTDEIFASEEDALAFIANLAEQTDDDPATIVPEEISAGTDVEFDRLPEAVQQAIEEKLDELREAWADEVAGVLESALGDVGV